MPANGSSLHALVIGCGSIGRRHAANLLALGVGRVLAVDPDASRRERLARELGVQPIATLDDAWAHTPQLAVIATPPSLHVPLALDAARHGCHLLIEKPLSDRLDGLDELAAELAARRLVALIGCNFRFHPALRKIKTLLDEDAVGRIVSARAEFGQHLPDWHPGEDYRHGYSATTRLGGGVILDAIHELDYLDWLLGPVEEVACMTATPGTLDIDTEGVAVMLLRFASGTLGEAHLDYVQRTYTRRCELVGEQGTIRWDDTEGCVRWYSAQTGVWTSWLVPPGWDSAQMYIDELRHWLRCVQGEESPAVDVAQGRRVLELALRVKRAAGPCPRLAPNPA